MWSVKVESDSRRLSTSSRRKKNEMQRENLDRDVVDRRPQTDGGGREFSLEDGEVRAEHCDFQGNTK